MAGNVRIVVFYDVRYRDESPAKMARLALNLKRKNEENNSKKVAEIFLKRNRKTNVEKEPPVASDVILLIRRLQSTLILSNFNFISFH